MKTSVTILSLSVAAFLMPLACMAQALPPAQPQAERPLINPVTKNISGNLLSPALPHAVREACQFSVSLAPGEKSIEARRVSEINVDRAHGTCNALFEVGQPAEAAALTPAEAANLKQTSENASSAVPVRIGAAAPLSQQPGVAQATVQSAGFLKTWWTDPINITINSVQDSTTWTWSGTGNCVNGILGGNSLTWFTPSGWFVASNSWQNTFNCTQTTSASTVKFQNNIFCVGISTFANYLPNQVNGQQNGTLVGTWNDTISGNICVNLVTFHHQLTRTQN
jgi:hypothetical protein